MFPEVKVFPITLTVSLHPLGCSLVVLRVRGYQRNDRVFSGSGEASNHKACP